MFQAITHWPEQFKRKATNIVQTNMIETLFISTKGEAENKCGASTY